MILNKINCQQRNPLKEHYKKRNCAFRINVALYGLKESAGLFHKDLACRLRKYGYYQNKTDSALPTPTI
jgi:hypothetical protein